MNCMTALVFVDTNVLVYRHDLSEPAKQRRSDDWLRLLVRLRSGRLSFQVLLELYAALTRKLRFGIDRRKAQEIVRDFTVWQPVAIDLGVMERAWRLQESHRISWWDALIVAAAQSCECRALLTEDLQHGHSFGRVQVINPFESPDWTPAQVLQSLES